MLHFFTFYTYSEHSLDLHTSINLYQSFYLNQTLFTQMEADAHKMCIVVTKNIHSQLSFILTSILFYA